MQDDGNDGLESPGNGVLVAELRCKDFSVLSESSNSNMWRGGEAHWPTAKACMIRPALSMKRSFAAAWK